MIILNNNESENTEYKIYSNNIKKFETFLFELLDNKEECDEIKKSNKLFVFISNILSVLRYLKIEPVCFPIGFIYLQRIKEKGCEILLKDIKLLLIISMLEAIKMYDDYGIFNIEYSKFVKTDIKIINLTEAYFLKKISFELYVKFEEYDDFIKKLI